MPVAAVAAPSDGTWIPIADPRAPAGAPAMFKTLVHPDANRSFAAVAIVAMDLTRLDLRLVAGLEELRSSAVPNAERPGLVPSSDLDAPRAGSPTLRLLRRSMFRARLHERRARACLTLCAVLVASGSAGDPASAAARPRLEA